ncbi:hypothetical protein DACRYDRAFT_114009 [Dacryopinax primogenitus]|uniref:Uncharacterized protein n=1 Tax=Dacryopinax primogenitus (strain DJM 731) TaxID=1858805 RepID=M5GDM0_DACPD|nr:uncharacterized protein DACRYDRAFT_114009 [Dacryopinax primogenitus]EJU04637.1 hypothetical protein DACRYDRAFT_114009 [Dacryopinax primogenitus]
MSPTPTDISSGARLPTDVLTHIAHHVHSHLLPPPSNLASLDPLPTLAFPPSTSTHDIPIALPSTIPSPQWPQWLVFHTLLSLTRTSSAWRTAALPALFSSLQITYPRSWLGLLAIVCGAEPSPTYDSHPELDPDSDQALLAQHLAHAASAAFLITERRARSPSREDTLRLSALAASIREALVRGSPGYHIPPELLSPPESRESSPSIPRGRRPLTAEDDSHPPRSPSSSTRSRSRWRLSRRVSDALQDVLRPRGVYVPALPDTHPGRFIREVSFAHFRTIHMRLPASTKHTGAGGPPRFVTPERLLRLLREVPEVRAFGATEYMDSALELAVLEELLLRGLGEKSRTGNAGASGGAEDRGRSGETKDLRAREKGRERTHRRRIGPRGGSGLHREAEEEQEAEVPANGPTTLENNTNPDGRADKQPEDTGAKPDQEDIDRWAECAPLEALDLCGCVSRVCGRALGDFVRRYPAKEGAVLPGASFGAVPGAPAGAALPAEVGLIGEDAQTSTNPKSRKPVSLPLQRLGMAGMSALPPATLHSFVLLFPNLTMLDISGTLAPPSLLYALAQSSTVRLLALSLARCPRLTGQSILALLLSPKCARLDQLNLFGDDSFPSPLLPGELHTLLTSSLFLSARLTFLDLSSAPLSPSHLALLPSQPNLRTLGLAHLPDLPLPAIRQFLETRAPNCEVLSLAHSCHQELGPAMRPGELSMTLHVQFLSPLCTPPFSFSAKPKQAKTRLRVLELAPEVLALLGEGGEPWCPVRSRGRRAWYVDKSAFWAQGRFCRVSPGFGSAFAFGFGSGVGVGQEGTAEEREERERELARERDEALAAKLWKAQVEEWALARGNVPTGVGWGGRKMEVVRGEGMVGREEGLYGMVSYAYAG